MVDTKKILADVKALTDEVQNLEYKVERLELVIEEQENIITFKTKTSDAKDEEIQRLKGRQWWRF